MAWTLVASTMKQPGVNGGATDAIDTTGANLIIAIVATNAGSAAAAANWSDSKSNGTPSTTSGRGNAGNGRIRTFYYSQPSSVGSGHTFTYSEASSSATIIILAFSGAATTTPLDQQSAGATAASGTSVSTGSATPSENGELLIAACCATSASASFAIDNGFTIIGAAYGDGDSMGAAAGYLVQGTAGALNPAFTWATSSGNAASLCTFKVAANGALYAAVRRCMESGASTFPNDKVG